MSGKGDTIRPLAVSQKTFAANHDRTFALYQSYKAALASGMFFELHPELTGDWKRDEAAWEHLHREHI